MTFAQVCKVTKWVDHEVVWAVETHLAEEKGRGIIEVATPFATSQRALTPYFSANRKSDITATLHWEQTLVKAFWIISLSCNSSSIPMSGIFSRRKIHWSTFLISVSYTPLILSCTAVQNPEFQDLSNLAWRQPVAKSHWLQLLSLELHW